MPPIPGLRREQALWQSGMRRVVGVDEAGRGPLAGPVVAAACLLPVDCAAIDGVRDSKRLSAVQRERLFPEIIARALAVGIGAASVGEIDRLNILRATCLAMRRALRRVGAFDHALIDGNEVRGFDPGPHSCLVGGDAHSYSVACASIVAKVVRDRLMSRLAPLYPAYGWDRNAGYGTAAHLEALGRTGPSPFHRRSFAPVRMALQQPLRLDVAGERREN